MTRTHHNPKASMVLGRGSSWILAAALLAVPALGCNNRDNSNDSGLLDDVSGASCGPCGVLSTGDVGISGSTRIDGLFSAVAQLDGSVTSIRAQFDTEILALAQAWDFEVDANARVDAALVGELLDSIEAQLTAATSGGIALSISPAKCSADISVAASAQASCEASAGCDVEAMGPSVAVTCEGICEGSCDQQCEGEVVCDASASGGIECVGACEGTCALEAAAPCEGTCRGSCTTDGDTREDFEGVCEGQCEGTCELAAGASCEGTCHGSCVVNSDVDLQCDSELTCRGECSGSCSGSCTGTVTPPSASAECEASADCQASAGAQASASLECSPPSIVLTYELDPSVSIDARARLQTQIHALQTHASAIIQGTSRLRGLVTGDLDADGSAEIEPAAVNLAAHFNALVDAGIDGGIFVDVAAGKLPCVIPAMIEAVEILASLPVEASTTLDAQVEFTTGLAALGT